MKKATFVITACLFIAFCCTAAPAASSEANPPDFQGIKWGTNINDLPELTRIEENDPIHSSSWAVIGYLHHRAKFGGNEGAFKTYRRAKDELSFEGESLDHPIIYGFYKDQFFLGYLIYTRQNIHDSTGYGELSIEEELRSIEREYSSELKIPGFLAPYGKPSHESDDSNLGRTYISWDQPNVTIGLTFERGIEGGKTARYHIDFCYSPLWEIFNKENPY